MSFSYNNYLEEQLNIVKSELSESDEGFLKIKIKVVDERSFKMPKEQGVILFLVKKISGSYVLGIKSQPVQIICYSEMNTLIIAQQILELFTKLHQNEQFYIDNILIKQNYDTPVVLRAFVPSDSGYKGSLYCYGTYIVCDSLSDIRELKYYNENKEEYEDLQYINASFGYGAVLTTAKIVGEELSTSTKQESGLILNVNFMNNNSDFCKKVNEIMFGDKSGNTNFKLKWSVNNKEYIKNMKLENAGLDTDRTSAPGLSVSFKL